MMLEKFEDYFDHEEPCIAEAAKILAEAKEALATGDITKSEFDEIANDVLQIKRVDELADDLDRKRLVGEALDGLILIASNII